MNCAKCQRRLPAKRCAATWGQRLLGGRTCPHCLTALDRQGRELAEDYNTPAAVALLVAFSAGLALSNYLYFWAGRAGLSVLTFALTLALGNLGARALQPKVRAD